MKAFLGTGITVGIMMALTIASGILTSRLLGVDERGILALVMLWPAVCGVLADLGTPIAIVQRAAVSKAEGAYALANLGLMSGILATLALPIGIAGVVLSNLSRNQLALAVLSLLIVTPMTISGRLFGALSQGLGNYRHYNYSKLVGPSIWLVLPLALYATHNVSLYSIVASYLAAAIVGFLAAAWPYRNMFSYPSRSTLNDLVALAREGLPNYLGNLTPIDSLKLDVALVGILFSATDVGYYSIAVSAAYLVRVFGFVVGIIALPTVSRSKGTRLGAICIRVISSVAFSGSLLAGMLMLVALPILIPLVYGRSFSPAVTPAQILAIGMAAAGFRQALGDCMRGIGKGKLVSWIELSSWAVAIIGGAILIPTLGLNGIAIAVSLSYISAATLCLILSAHQLEVSYASLMVPNVKATRTMIANQLA